MLQKRNGDERTKAQNQDSKKLLVRLEILGAIAAVLASLAGIGMFIISTLDYTRQNIDEGAYAQADVDSSAENPNVLERKVSLTDFEGFYVGDVEHDNRRKAAALEIVRLTEEDSLIVMSCILTLPDGPAVIQEEAVFNRNHGKLLLMNTNYDVYFDEKNVLTFDPLGDKKKYTFRKEVND